MPPKSKKAAAEKKAKIIDDKTFGLKNKNRSTKVQNFVQSVSKNVGSGNPNERKQQQVNEEKRAAKEAKRIFEEELNTLFTDADREKTKKDKEAAAAAAANGEDDKNLGVNPEDYLWTADDFDVVEEDTRRLEDKLEAERELLKDRTDLTPVTEETFQAWKAQKRKEAADAEKARVQKAKSHGGLRGKDLWEHDKTLFVDDDEADDEYYAAEDEEEDEEDDE